MKYTRYIYNRINWMNKSESLSTPLGKNNLNRMDSAIYQIAENLDVVHEELSAGKFDEVNAGKVIVGMPTWNPNTGILTFQFYDGTQFSIDFNIEKIPVSFSMDSAGVITMETSDGTKWTADIGDVIPDFTFEDSDTVAFQVGYDWDLGEYVENDIEYGYGEPENWGTGEHAGTSYLDVLTGILYTCVFGHGVFYVVTSQLERGKNRRIFASVKKNSITDEYLQPNYLADITTQAASAAASAQSAKESADCAAYDAKLAQSYSVGGSGVREGEDTDNAKKCKEACEDALAKMQAVQVTGVKGNAESKFRQGEVNLTPENIGALPTTGGRATGNISVEVESGEAQVNVSRPNHAGRLVVSSSDKFGLYDATNGFWLVQSDINGNVTFIGADEKGYNLTDKLNLLATKYTEGNRASLSFNADVGRMYLVTYKSTGLYNSSYIIYAALVSIVGVSAKALHVIDIVNDRSNFKVSISNSGQEVSISSDSVAANYERINVWMI